jgi:hypothetical protein
MARNESKGKGLIQSLINSMCKKKLKNSTLYIKQFISTNMKYDGARWWYTSTLGSRLSTK